MSEIVVQTRELGKRYGRVHALDGVSLEVRRGEVLGLLGPNGAGKTTLLEILLGLRQPDEGSFNVLGTEGHQDLKPIRSRMGIVTQMVALPQRLTVQELFDLQSTLYEAPVPVESLLARLGLAEKADSEIRQLSGGQAQRVSVGLALLGDPELFFLDEPTAAMDPHARRGIWELLRDRRAAERTIILSTHRMEEAQSLCTRVAIIDRGKVLANDSPAALIAKYCPSQVVRFRTEATARVPDAELEVDPTDSRYAFAKIRTRKLESILGMLVEARSLGSFSFDDLNVERSTLEDVFMHLTGRAMRS